MELRVDGEPVHVERKPLEVLKYLLRHAGEVVTKDELAENLWPGRILTETVLTRAISQLRQALGDRKRALVRTVHGFGYRLDTVPELAPAQAIRPPTFTFGPGDYPPRRPQWRLAERLGTGGHGEAWLARHTKTNEPRVFKFALDEGALGSLKREVTLYRVLRDSLGENGAFLKILEWNVEQAPYFLEVEYAAGGNLLAWCEARGGVSQVPFETRLELAAQIAEALAAAHSVGVLHKDLKPSNILIEGKNSPRALLCDFGSGGVVDTRRLENLGITRLGFTKTLSEGGAMAGTPLYLAPEVIAGQPFTVKADIYALAVILFQLVTGDMRKTLAPGWDLELEDDLLKEDIAEAAAGDPSRRLGDAGELAVRLRTLATRHRARAIDLQEKESAARAHQASQELRRTRVVAGLLSFLTVLAVTGGIVAYQARNEAIKATATAKAISDFLSEDLLGIDPAAQKPRDVSLEVILARAADTVDRRLGQQPAAAGDIHWLLGRRFEELGRTKAAAQQYEYATSALSDAYGPEAQPTLLALDRLAKAYATEGRVSEAMDIVDRIELGWAKLLKQKSLSMFMVRIRTARLRLYVGDYMVGAKTLRSIIEELSLGAESDAHTRRFVEDWAGIELNTDASGVRHDYELAELVGALARGILASDFVLEYREDYQEAERQLSSSVAVLEKHLGNSGATAIGKWTLGYVRAVLGDFEGAQQLIDESRTFMTGWLPETHWMHALPLSMLARLRLEQRGPEAALGLTDQALDLCSAECSPTATSLVRYDIGLAKEQLGDWEEAEHRFAQLLHDEERVWGPNRLGALRCRVRVALAQVKQGRLLDAVTSMRQIPPDALSSLPVGHQLLADMDRVQGLVDLQKGNLEPAREALKRAFEVTESRFGTKNWRTEKVRHDFDLALGRI